MDIIEECFEVHLTVSTKPQLANQIHSNQVKIFHFTTMLCTLIFQTEEKMAAISKADTTPHHSCLL